jgi:hypothetical protein
MQLGAEPRGFIHDRFVFESTCSVPILFSHEIPAPKKFIRWPFTAVIDKLAEEFQRIHQIPYVVGVVDGSHIPIVAPRLHAADYYNCKGFHSVLLQGVVSSKCFFLGFRHRLGWIHA